MYQCIYPFLKWHYYYAISHGCCFTANVGQHKCTVCGCVSRRRHPLSRYELFMNMHNVLENDLSFNELSDLHITQTTASKVHTSVVTGWPSACLHKLLPRGHQGGNWRKPHIKDISNLFNIFPTNPIQVFCIHEIFEDFVCALQMIFFDIIKNRYWHLGPTAKTGIILTDCAQSSPGPSVPYIPLGVYHTGGFNATLAPIARPLVFKWLP